MRIAICDDNRLCRAHVTDLLHDYVEQRHDKSITLSVFSEPEALLAAHREAAFDIYILDIVMPGLNGIELGKALRKDSTESKIIYLTSSEEYALDSFQVRPLHYLMKPVERDALFPVLDEAVASISLRRDKSLIIKTRDSSVRVAYDSLLYAERSLRAVVYHLVDGKTVESTSLRSTFSEALKELLADPRFSLCGASTVVNLHHITAVEMDCVLFQDSLRLPLGVKACRELRTVWNEYWLSGEV